MGFCECTARFALFVFNLACAILGLVIVGIVVAAIIHAKPLKDVISSQMTAVNIILIVVGALVFLIAFFGCCGAIRESHCMLTTYGVVLSTLLIVQLALGVTAFVYRNKVEDGLETTIEKMFENKDKDQASKDIIDEIQIDLNCCGVDGPKWWEVLNLPPSCCGHREGSCTIATSYTDGCESKITDALKSSLKIIGAVAIGICAVELICVIFAFCLASTYRKWSYR